MRSNNRINTEIRTIRAHHLLCIQGFQGRGYSPEFIKNMREIKKFLQMNPSTPIKVSCEVDAICKYCPHKIDASCKKFPEAEKKIKKMDLKSLKYLGLKEKNVYNYSHIQKLITEKLSFKDLKKICGFCRWIKYCKLHQCNELIFKCK